mmetsp:Transcript_66787/g.144091  ORF Transcript_66787/g.144091 Transcript_66787/m.144091 type:complete len:132 (+) Transcript_66787:650-1045(+)
MLYFDAKVKDTDATVFVDTGAQMTIMSMDFVRKCNLEYLLDTRFTGTAKGVGETNILGRIHAAPMYISGKKIEISIRVLEGDIQFIFGLDNMKKFRCKIDLFEHRLEFHDADISVNFLKDSELNFRECKKQ